VPCSKAILGGLWFYAFMGMLAIMPIMAFLAARWEDLGVKHDLYISLGLFLGMVMFLMFFLMLVSLIFNAKFQGREEYNHPSQTDQ
jgi:hypothetical protein